MSTKGTIRYWGIGGGKNRYEPHLFLSFHIYHECLDNRYYLEMEVGIGSLFFFDWITRFPRILVGLVSSRASD